MNRNVSTVDYNISRFFIQMRTNVNVTYDDGGVPTVTGDCAADAHQTGGGEARARTGAPRRTVWQRAR
jgi:hypothetical protein